MKCIYELCIWYTDGTKTNLLFNREKDAIKDKENCYKPGKKTTNGIIEISFIIKRTLF